MPNGLASIPQTLVSGLKARHLSAWGEAPGQRTRNQVSPVGARGRAGFTRSELLFMLATIAVLCGLAVSGLRGARSTAMVGKCMSQQKATFVGLHTYASAHDGKFPTSVPVEDFRAAQGPADPILVLYFRAAAKELDFPAGFGIREKRSESSQPIGQRCPAAISASFSVWMPSGIPQR